MLSNEAAESILRKFYEAAGGQFWPERLKWDLSKGPSAWEGVRLDAIGRVVGLEVAFNEAEKINFAECFDWHGSGNEDAKGTPANGPPPVEPVNQETPPLGLPFMDGKLDWIGSGIREKRSPPTIAPALVKLTTLGMLHLELPLIGSIPKGIGRLRKLVMLRLNCCLNFWGDKSNGLEGGVSQELESMRDLRMLDLRWNRLNGKIPTWINKLFNLEVLVLDGNMLEGEIPESLTKLGKLKVLTLSKNRLSGSIPISLGLLKQLQVLDLSNNELSGEIPGQLGNLEMLVRLDLFKNKLSYSIPYSLEKLKRVKVMNLSENQLLGKCGQ